MPKPIHIIVACAENRVIGRNGRLPWRIPEDLKYFHDETAGKICVLGRVCYETWPRVHADGRRPVVLTSHLLVHGRSAPAADRANSSPSGAPVVPAGARPPIPVHSLTEALTVAETLPGEIYVCGGQRIYEETLKLNRPMWLHLTLVHAEVEGDTFFPEWRHLPWREISRRESGDANYRYTFFTYELAS
ncbi:MAG: dihydrofolate reductase [Opitutaceae bacterium]|nr:dihydrofolate reductase [Opitutaceae bacterium]